MEGNRNLSTEIKYRDKVYIDPKPVIIACNNAIWSEVQSAYDAVQARCIHIQMLQVAPPQLTLHGSQEDLQIALKKLYEYVSNFIG